MVSFCLLLLNDAETQSRLGHQESEGHGWQSKEGPSPAPPTTREGASCGCSWGRAAASRPEKGAVPCLLFQPALVCTGVGSHMLQPRRDLDQMATPLHPSSGIEMGFGRAGVKGGGPAGDLGQDPGLMSYPGASGAASTLGAGQNETGTSPSPGNGHTEGSPACAVSPALRRGRYSCAGLGKPCRHMACLRRKLHRFDFAWL